MDFFEQETVSLYLKNLRLIEDASSELQSIQLYEHVQLGKTLIINNEIQHIEKWMPFYHEAIVHIPSMFLKRITKVLILGGGDLFAAAEVLKYTSVTQVDLCDYDQCVIDLTSKYYLHGKNVLSDKRFHLIIENAALFLQRCQNQYDLIIDDCFNLVQYFKDHQIFLLLKDKLSPNGVCCSLVYRHIFDHDTMAKTFNRLCKTQKTVYSLVTVPEYPGILHLLTIWGKSDSLNQNMHHSKNREHLHRINKQCQLFNSRFCDFYLYLPPYLKEMIEDLSHDS